ncbi:hypothetical protein QM925_06340 [Streptococcus cristatus]
MKERFPAEKQLWKSFFLFKNAGKYDILKQSKKKMGQPRMNL